MKSRCSVTGRNDSEFNQGGRSAGGMGAGRRVLPVRGAMDGFVATFVNRLDQKGRVSVPAPFRSVLAREGEDGLYAYPALDQPAIDCGGARLRQAIAERLNIFATFSEDHESLSTAFYGESRVLKIDPDGRVVLPEEFIAHVGITETAVFVGQGFKFQIWEPQRFAERRAAARAQLRSVTSALGRTNPTAVSGKGEPA